MKKLVSIVENQWFSLKPMEDERLLMRFKRETHGPNESIMMVWNLILLYFSKYIIFKNKKEKMLWTVKSKLFENNHLPSSKLFI